MNKLTTLFLGIIGASTLFSFFAAMLFVVLHNFFGKTNDEWNLMKSKESDSSEKFGMYKSATQQKINR